MKRFNHILVLTAVICVSCNTYHCSRGRELPLYHFSPCVGMAAEPSALVFCEGVYHLYYLFDKDSSFSFGLGHSVSRDLVHWEDCPISIQPSNDSRLLFGNVVADTLNTSGLGVDGNSPFLAFYSDELSGVISYAFSLDNGYSWELNSSSPLIEGTDLQYPNVSYDEGLGIWIMTATTSSSVVFLSSSDCLHWVFLSEFRDEAQSTGYSFREARLLKIDSSSSIGDIYALIINMSTGSSGGPSSARYFVGTFDGESFSVIQNKELWLDYGSDCKSAVSTNVNGDNVWIAWMNNWRYALDLPPELYRGRMTLPRKILYANEGSIVVLSSLPAIDFQTYSKELLSLEEMTVSNTDSYAYGLKGEAGRAMEIKVSFDNKDRMAIWKAMEFGIRLYSSKGECLTVGYSNELGYYFIDRGVMTWDSETQRMGAALRTVDPELDMDIVIDSGSVELFASGGKVNITSLWSVNNPFCKIELYAINGSVHLNNMKVELISQGS